ncbi:MAG: hypothetical protein IOC35_04035 [Methylobacterium sp.]|nr:hypothetical protein [Methylobacterium sp.]
MPIDDPGGSTAFWPLTSRRWAIGRALSIPKGRWLTILKQPVARAREIFRRSMQSCPGPCNLARAHQKKARFIVEAGLSWFDCRKKGGISRAGGAATAHSPSRPRRPEPRIAALLLMMFVISI